MTKDWTLEVGFERDPVDWTPEGWVEPVLVTTTLIEGMINSIEIENGTREMIRLDLIRAIKGKDKPTPHPSTSQGRILNTVVRLWEEDDSYTADMTKLLKKLIKRIERNTKLTNELFPDLARAMLACDDADSPHQVFEFAEELSNRRFLEVSDE